MTNTSVITYDPALKGKQKYIPMMFGMSTNPYLPSSDDAYREETFNDAHYYLEWYVDPDTGEFFSLDVNNVPEKEENIFYLGERRESTLSQREQEIRKKTSVVESSPGKIVIESPDEAFFHYSLVSGEGLEGSGIATISDEDQRKIKTVATLTGASNPVSVTTDGTMTAVDGADLRKLLGDKQRAHNNPVEDTPEPPAEDHPEPPAPNTNPGPEESGTIPSDDPAATDEHADETDNSGDNMAKYDELAAAKGKLIRKALGGFIMVAPMDVEVPEKIFADKEGNFVDFKKLGFTPLGWLTKGDGINFSRETEQAEVESFGAQEPTRVDFTKDTTSAAFNCQETNKKVLELYYSQDLSEVKPDSETGEISFEQRDPETIYRRMIYIAHDGKGKDAKYIVKIMPKATISEVQEQAWSSESELAYGMTAKASKDDDLGYSVRHVFGGPGFEKLYADMGFTKPKTASGSGNTASQ